MLLTWGISQRGYPAATLDLSFTNGTSIDARLAASGATNGTRTDATGVIVAATTPRFDFDPVTLLCKGVLVEAQVQNLLLNSLLNGTNLSTQSVTVTAVAHTLSFYGTGTVTLTGVSTAGPAVGSGAYPARTTLTFTPTAGSLTLTVTGTVQFANLEIGVAATSFIPTAGSPVTRTVDIMTMGGGDFTAWFNATQGTIVSEGSCLEVGSAGRAGVSLHDGTTNNRMTVGHGTASGTTLAFMNVAAVNQLSGVEGAPTTANAVSKSALAYVENNTAAAGNGQFGGADVACSIPAVNALRVGANIATGGAGVLNGHIRRLTYYPQRLSGPALMGLTQL